jgi:hypothetical protein
MSNNTITDEQYQQALAIVAERDRQIQAENARRSQLAYDRLKVVTESQQFAYVHEQLVDAMDGLTSDPVFSLQAQALIDIMPRLVNAVDMWSPIVTAPAPVVTPPAPEGNTDGE